MFDKIKAVSERELSKKAKGFWLKALGALEARDHEYAVKLIQEVLKEFPGFFEGRKTARKCALKYKGIRKSGHQANLFDASDDGSEFSIATIRATKASNPHEALQMLEVELAKNPCNLALNNFFYEASLSLGMLDEAAFALETIRMAKNANAAHLYRLAELYMARDMPKEAKAVYSEIITMDPSDSRAYKGCKVASSRLSMLKAKQIESGGYKPQRAQEDPVLQIGLPELKRWTRDQQREHLVKLMELYQQDNRDLLVVRKLGELYVEMGHFSDAHVFYEWAATLAPEDPFYANQAKRMKRRMQEKKFQSLRKNAKENPEDGNLQERFAKARLKRANMRIEELEAQVEADSSNYSLRYELASELVEIGDYPAAIPHLQQTAKEVPFRIQSLQLLAKTFVFKGVFDLAIKQLNTALGELVAMDEQKKELLYEKGLVYEKMERQRRSCKAFQLIYDTDPNYRDVASRLGSENGETAYLPS